MSRLIDADALMAEWEEPKDWLDREQILRHYTWFKAVIEYQPTVEAVPVVHGRWIDKDGGLATCSECGDRWGVWSVMNFCPTCGASMTEGAEE